MIVNFPTKRHWRDQSKLADIGLGLARLAIYLHDFDVSVGMPALGCGLGGLDFADVKKHVVASFAHLPARVSLFEPGGQ